MDEVEKRIRLRLKNDFEHYALKCLKIRSEKDGLTSFKLNKAQRYLHSKIENQKRETGRVRAIIVKGRQQGCSTYIEGRFFWLVTQLPGVRAFILTHDIGATNNLFEIAKRFYEFCPSVVRPICEKSNAKELIFAGIDSGYKLGTAGNKSVGRSSTIQLFHGSETGYWPHAVEHAKGILQAIPDVAGTEIFIESTANGVGNYFHEQWQLAERGESNFIPIFIPWFWKEECQKEVTEDFVITPEEEELIEFYKLTPKNIMWRRNKIVEFSTGGQNGIKSFQQEYPSNATEAFVLSGEDTFITSEMIMHALKFDLVERNGSLLLGVDPARYGDDRTSFIFRQGREAFGLESHLKKNTMEVAGMIHRLIIEKSPDRVLVDIGGLGAGIYDRLIELGHKDVVIGVNGGETPLDQKKYYNKRAEMWGEMKDWLLNKPCKIPDKDTLHSDLTGIKYTIDSNSRLKLEPKENMKKRGLRSPDEADALSLTFAIPVSYYHSKNYYINAGKQILYSQNHIDRLKKKSYNI